MAAYAFARLRWAGRDKVFALFLATMMVPPIFTALPNFLLIKNLGLLNSFAGLALPFLFMTPFAIFFLRQFFLNMSREVEEAAMLDGAKHLRIFFQIVLPNAAAPLATLALLTFIGQWNEYFWPLLVGQDENVRVLTVGLSVFKSQSPQGAPDWSGLMAATIVAALPVLLLFFAFGKKVVNSIGFSGIK
jgi:multiple sugar transport system permease protein